MYTAEHFKGFWPTPYEESWCAYPAGTREVVRDVLASKSQGSVALDIGCGNGRFTREWLSPLFDTVCAVDLFDCPDAFCGTPVRYSRVTDYTLSPIPDESIDFVWSFGVFCHLPVTARRAYYASIFRVLKRGGAMVVMEPNWLRHARLKRETGGPAYAEHAHEIKWFYGDVETTRANVESAGLVNFADVLPGFRDTLGYAEKP